MKQNFSLHLKPYPSYKPTSIEWLGDVPAHWDVLPLKHWLRMNEAVLSETTDPNFEFRYIDIGSVGTGVLIEKPQKMRFATAPSRARRIVRDGDTIISTVRTYLKAVWFVEDTNGNFICSTGFVVLTPRPGTLPKFVSYLTQNNAFIDRLTANSVGIAYPAITESRLGSFQVAVPPFLEQTAIAHYLDSADRRIHRYVSSRERLIELLEEYRQAAIHHAVTRGLDPDVRLKPSGVEWLGDVPAHWEVRRLKTLCSMRSGDSITAMSIESAGEYPVYGGNGLRGYTSNYTHDGNYVLIGRQGALCGNVHIARGQFWASEHAVVATLSTGYVLEWFAAILNVMDLNQYSLAAAQPGLAVERVLNLSLPMPPPQEQAHIARYIERETVDIDASIDRARREIELLSEYRTRLIADVVTGQVDVRDVARLPDEVE